MWTHNKDEKDNLVKTRKTDKFIYKKHFDELEYSRLDDGHMIKNLYSEEITFLKVFNSPFF